jgi:hypothetical protein
VRGTEISNRHFLDQMTSMCYCFSERNKEARLALLVGAAQPGLKRSVAGTTRKWRRKPLESLKTDSEMAMSRIPSAGNGNCSADSYHSRARANA